MKSNVNGLGSRIVQVRRRLALTQLQFSRRLGVSRNSVVLYERGRTPHSVVLDRIGRLGGVSLEWLLHGSTRTVPDGDPAWRKTVGLLRSVWEDHPERRALVRRVLRALRPG